MIKLSDSILELPEGTRIQILAPVSCRGRKGGICKIIRRFFKKMAFVRVKIDGELLEISDDIDLDRKKKACIFVICKIE